MNDFNEEYPTERTHEPFWKSAVYLKQKIGRR